MAEFATFPGRGELTDTLACHIAKSLTDAIEQRGGASLVLSGGSSPKSVYARLAELPLDWSRVFVTLADERWVEPESPDSNERMIRELLLDAGAGAAHFVPLKTAAADPGSALNEVAAALEPVPRPFDVVLLGMGDDGHTASIFPAAGGLREALTTEAPVAAVLPDAAPHSRITLSKRALLDSRFIAVLIQGDAKRRVYDLAAGHGPVEQFPVRTVLHQDKVPVTVYWAP